MQENGTDAQSSTQSNGANEEILDSHVASRGRKFFRTEHLLHEEEFKENQKSNRSSEKTVDKEKLIEYIRENVVGDNQVFKTPFGYRKITYCDYIASGRSLDFLEQYIHSQVLPFYANTHTTNTITGLQTTLFRHEARQLIMDSVNCYVKTDRLVFCGQGATGALNKLVHAFAKKDDQIVVFVSQMEHHSNLLPWRESANTSVVLIPEHVETGLLDLQFLEEQLRHYSKQRITMVGSFSACSNVTGILADTIAVTALLKKYGAFSVWDYATAAPYVKIDMNPVVTGIDRNLLRKDAIVLSPHKFIGGVETPGILIAKKHMFRNPVPETPGGGTVFFVTEKDHRYLKKAYEREEGGTQSIVGAIRTGLVFQLKNAVGEDEIRRREELFIKRALDRFSKNPNIVLLGNTKVDRVAIASFMVKHNSRFLHCNFVSVLLNDLFGIQTRSGCVCAGPMGLHLMGVDYETAKEIEKVLLENDDHEFLRPGFTRLNFNYFMDDQSFQFVLDAVDFVAQEGWKLLPQYTFYPETGEWVHVYNKKFLTRRWLHNITYDNGKMEFRQPVSRSGTEKELKGYLEEAKRLVEKAIEDRSIQIAQQNGMLQPHAEKLRWFIYPSEALAELKGAQVEYDSYCPIQPRVYKKKEEEEEAEAVMSTPSTDFASLMDHSSKHEDALPNALDVPTLEAPSVEAPAKPIKFKPFKSALWKMPDKNIMRPFFKALKDYGMIKDGDKVLLGLSGGKDSLTMLHALRAFRYGKANIKFELGACTVDPQTDSYDPAPLKEYMKQLGVPYYFESQDIIESAKRSNPRSICAWCSRMKRGILYNVARNNGYNVLVLAQHLDDLAESFVMSIFHNGYLRTQKACYMNDAGDVRVVRPFVYVREKDIKVFARSSGMPIINENCPACFEMPTERARIKTLLSTQEHLFPSLFSSLLTCMRPLMEKDIGNKLAPLHKKFKSVFKTGDDFEEEDDEQGQQEMKETQNVEAAAVPELTTEQIKLLLAKVDTSLLQEELQKRSKQ